MAASKSAARKKKKKSTAPRASWKGNLVFGLVTFPVQAINALNRQESDFRFHQLHAGCHRRIHYQKVCPVHGEVSQDEIVSGYEIRKGKYVEITDEELDSVRTDRLRALTIDAFIEAEAIDPLYLDGRMYYLVPDGDVAREPYALIREALEREGRWGIGQIVLSGKEQLALVRPLKGLLQMAMLNYDEELRQPEDLLPVELPRPAARQLKLAQSLVRHWATDKFDFTTYDDEYRQRVAELIEAKVAGREVVVPEEPEPPEVIDLMDALKQSLDRRPHRGRRSSRRTG